MKRALFIDHSFHRKTRSADFFVDIVRQDFEVEVYYLTPEEKPDTGVLKAAADADVVLLWQMDFLAPVFLAMGKPTIVIPMFDGSGEMPDLHWLFAGSARFFNFSLRLNERIRLLGGETMYLRYFPPAVEESELPRFDRLNAFFWQRRPDHGLDFKYIDSLIGADLNAFHLHNAPDILGSFEVKIPEDAAYEFTESTWFKEKSDYQAHLKNSNVFVAPRVAEGIGMALLEAMARGMLVVAHDAPTNNEYVSNWVNGILFNKDAPPHPVQIRHDASRLGRMAWRTVVEGHKSWIASHDSIRRWINDAPAREPIELDLETFFADLWYSYYGSLDSYDLFLCRHLAVLERLSPLSFDEMIRTIGRASDHRGESTGARPSVLDVNGLLDLTAVNGGFTGPGWSTPEPEWRWAIGKSSKLHFSGFVSISKRVRARFTATSLPELGKRVQCTIAMNGAAVFDGPITPGWKEYEFVFDAALLKEENHLTLVFDKAMSIPGDRREMSVCFKSFRFSADLDAVPGHKASDLKRPGNSGTRVLRRLLSRI